MKILEKWVMAEQTRKTMPALPHAALDLQTTFYTNHVCFMEAAVEPLRLTCPDFIPDSRISTLQG